MTTHINRGNKKFGISNAEHSMLEAALEEEYRLLEDVRRFHFSPPETV